MTEVVLDASVVIAWLQGEVGWQAADAAIRDGRLGAVNLAEVATWLAQGALPEVEVTRTIEELPCHIVPFDPDLAMQTGLLRQATRAHGLSLGDRACLALALREGLPVLTADRAWAGLEVGIEIRMLR